MEFNETILVIIHITITFPWWSIEAIELLKQDFLRSNFLQNPYFGQENLDFPVLDRKVFACTVQVF